MAHFMLAGCFIRNQTVPTLSRWLVMFVLAWGLARRLHLKAETYSKSQVNDTERKLYIYIYFFFWSTNSKHALRVALSLTRPGGVMVKVVRSESGRSAG